jgi:hypothetical protein
MRLGWFVEAALEFDRLDDGTKLESSLHVHWTNPRTATVGVEPDDGAWRQRLFPTRARAAAGPTRPVHQRDLRVLYHAVAHILHLDSELPSMILRRSAEVECQVRQIEADDGKGRIRLCEDVSAETNVRRADDLGLFHTVRQRESAGLL